MKMFSKQTSKAASEWELKTVLDSPTTSLGRPYSLPSASRICPSFCCQLGQDLECGSKNTTYVNVDLHAIAPGAAHNGRDHDQRVLGDKVPDAAFLLLALASGVRLKIELEAISSANEQQQAAEAL